ncbi:unnamed protein product [Aspergillus oryzae]|nr:unnamed protein product [Aspergillus oryzae]GMF88800.1 unnamed protein product [Aspergillus oryzae]
MTAFSRFPQAWILRLTVPPADRITFHASHIQSLQFKEGDLVCGLYRVQERTPSKAVLELLFKGEVSGRMVIRFWEDGEDVVFCTETIMWTRKVNAGQGKRVIVPLENPMLKFLHEMAAWWLIDSGVTYLLDLKGNSPLEANQPSLTSDSKYIPLEGDTANFPIISNAMVIQSMRRSGYCSGWDADISGSDARPASLKSRVGKTCRLGRRRKHSGGNAHNHSSAVPHNVSGLDSRITTRYKDIAAATEEDPGYEAEDDERGRTTLKSRRYSPLSLGRIYELPGSFPEPDESAYDTAPEDTASPSEEGSSDLSHERLLTAMEATVCLILDKKCDLLFWVPTCPSLAL